MANLFTQITGYGRTFSARMSELGALTAYRLLVVVYYSAPLIANLEGIVDGGLVEDHTDKSVPVFQASKVVICTKAHNTDVYIVATGGGGVALRV